MTDGPTTTDASSSRVVVAVFGASQPLPGHPAWTDAERCGRLLAEAGLTVATGGYGGVMEGASKGAAEAGGHVIGVTAPPIFPNRPGPNGWVTDERPAASLTARLDLLLSAASAVIALPGSIGTLTELMVAWNTAFITSLGLPEGGDAVAGGRPLPVVAVGAVWAEMVSSIASRLDTRAGLVTCVDTVDEAVAAVIARLPEVSGRPRS
jgi:uncharacterized protein (TIGR00725 family)